MYSWIQVVIIILIDYRCCKDLGEDTPNDITAVPSTTAERRPAVGRHARPPQPLRNYVTIT